MRQSAPSWHEMTHRSRRQNLICALALCVLSLVALPVPVAEAQQAPVRISEFMAANPGPFLDDDGNSSDWIELQNVSAQPVTLGGWSLQDSANSWTLPNVTIAAGQYLIVWASGEDRSSLQSPLHTSFKLTAGGEYLALRDPDGVAATEFSPSYPAQSAGVSYGFDANGEAGFMVGATPESVNTAIARPQAASPTATLGNSIQESSLTEQLTSTTPNATIHYTLDGSIPTAASPVAVNGSVSINPTAGVTTLRTVSAVDGYASSKPSTFTYINPEAAAESVGGGADAADGIRSLSVVSITTDSQGDPSSADSYDGARVDYVDLAGPGFSEGVGVKLSGQSSLNSPKKTMRLNFSSAYGPSELEYPLFDDRAGNFFEPATRFDQLELRGYSADGFYLSFGGTHLSNEFSRELTLDLGSLSSHGRPVTLFVNGTFRGLYQLRERINEDWLSEYLGGSGSDYESLFVDDVLRTQRLNSGTGEIFAAVNSASSYQEVKDIADARSLINSSLALWNQASYNEQEWRVLGPSDPGRPGGMHFIPQDVDAAFDRLYLPGRSAGMRGFLNTFDDDPEFKQILWDQAASAFCGDGEMTVVKMHERLDRLAAEIAPAIASEVAAWNWGSVAQWNSQATQARQRISTGAIATRDGWSAAGWFNGCERAPQIMAPPSVLVMAGQDVDFTIDAVDPDGDTVTFSATGLPNGIQIDQATGQLSGAASTDGSFTGRVRATDSNGRWLESPVHWEVLPTSAGSAPFRLNELNTVDNSGAWSGSDPAFPGSADNGGDWFELLVLDDTDLRGWSIEVWDRDRKSNLYKQTERFTFANDNRLASVPAGLIVTISEDIAEDPNYDEFNDWHINATASSELNGELLAPEGRSNFDTSAAGIQFVARNPAGEYSGLLAGATESWIDANRDLDGTQIVATCITGQVADAAVDYRIETATSTFGQPNRCGESVQDLDELRNLLLPGDTNCDQTITTADTQALLDYTVGLRSVATCPLGPQQVDTRTADLNDDGIINLLDALLLANCAADQAEGCR